MTQHKYASTLAEAAAYAVRGGLDLEDADDTNHTAFAGIAQAIKQGLLSEADVDKSVTRLMYVRMKTGEFDDLADQPYAQIGPANIRSASHLALTREVAVKSFVLLENKNKTLPLATTKRLTVAVVGPFADCQACYYGKYSPHMDVNKTVTVAGGIQTRGHTVRVAVGCSQHPSSLGRDVVSGTAGSYSGSHADPFGDATSDTAATDRSGHHHSNGHSTFLNIADDTRVGRGCGCASCPCPSPGGSKPYMCESYDKASVVAAVAAADVVVLAVGLGANVESEGLDRESHGLALPGKQNSLVADTIGAANAEGVPVVALLFVAGPVDPTLFDDADAIVDCVYPAESTGLAVADVLFGDVSPAGRLPFSWPTLATDVPPERNYTMAGRTYRYGQRNVRWAFGHGRSYSTFTYGKAILGAHSITASSCSSVLIRIPVTNSGSVDGDEVVQAYIRWKDVTPGADVQTPDLSLVGFERVALPVGGSATVELSIEPRGMAVLTDPRCGVVPLSPNTKLSGSPFSTSPAAAVGDCCAQCAALERCEAFTFFAAGRVCHLFTAWALSTNAPGATSGEPLSQWVVRQSVLEVLVGGSSSTAALVGTVTVTGPETALTNCELPMSD
jgi:beta-glucosidase